MSLREWLARFAIAFLSVSAIPALAQGSQQKGIHVDCPSSGGSIIYWLYVNSATGQCDETTKGVYECWDTSSTSDAKLTCATGCEYYDNDAGCQIKARRSDPNLVDPNADITCPNGAKYRLRDTQSGARCSRDTDSGGNTTGGTCTHNHVETAQFTCENGCEFDGGTATCSIL